MRIVTSTVVVVEEGNDEDEEPCATETASYVDVLKTVFVRETITVRERDELER